VITDIFLSAIWLEVVLFSAILLFMVVKSSPAKMLAKGSIDIQINKQVYNDKNHA